MARIYFGSAKECKLVIVQAIADGRFANVSEARTLVAREATDGVYTPRAPEAWAEARGRFERLEREWGG